MGFVAVPRGELAALLDIVWVVPDGRVPDDGEGVDDEGEGDGTLDSEADPVTRLADAAGLLRILYRNLDSYVVTPVVSRRIGLCGYASCLIAVSGPKPGWQTAGPQREG